LVFALAPLMACAKLDLPPEPAPGCAQSVNLDGTATTADPPIAVDLGAADICLRLDATKNIQSAHLAIAVGPQQDGATTTFHSTLLDLDSTILQTGWDVQVDNRVSHTLEWSLDAGEIRDVTLHVARSAPTARTSISVSLFEPFE
jgi:hypothetical protein